MLSWNYHPMVLTAVSPLISILTHWTGILIMSFSQDTMILWNFTVNYNFCCKHKHLHEQILCHLLSQPVVHIKEE